jgi:hypothetical protein
VVRSHFDDEFDGAVIADLGREVHVSMPIADRLDDLCIQRIVRDEETEVASTDTEPRLYAPWEQ